MRYLAINLVQEGMKVGKTIFNEQGVVLISANSVLTSPAINKLEQLGYKGLLIDDEFSQGVEYHENFVSNEVRVSLAKKLNSALNLSSCGKIPHSEIDGLQSMLSDIVDEMLSRREINLNLLELKMFDNYTYFHSVNVAVIALAIAFNMKLKRSDMLIVGTAALLHDIGKLFIGTEIVNKPGSLTDEEYEIMKTHSEKGYKVLSSGNGLSLKTTISVLSHHEHYDGSGYPNGLAGEDIILFGRIICIADVYDALTSDRPYRKGCSVIEAIEYVMANSGTLFDPKLVKIFSSKIYPFPEGATVLLSNGETGLVLSNNHEFCLRPKLKITSGSDHRIVDLIYDTEYRSVVITGLEQ
ncbi:cyclic di-GMP phosphodiesterase response regulator RpfG [Ruminiclostridium hungatei]|uniref:Cyclic di-GMP phosphodiesterase response regulator RpfG n=1 Tax=Ruminiclostridium hungatei TaxID=48256 RepID=A0A1V4SI97_RUMHU|nr:HD-GYP domain-containing protein [Ruminiclostridium hungatei]OPX43534.1 cyclic di-GMP phosphodiesterase response regulator RpfG [Ruminiclostridium hungatei]